MAALKRGQQDGYVLLLTLITLLVLLFGILFTMRGTLLQTEMTGNTLQRQKDVQASDLALRIMQQTILSTTQQGTQSLEAAANGQPWFFTPSVTSTPWPAPDPNYWASCSATSSSKPCGTVPGMPLGYTGQVIVVPTNLPPGGPSACGGNPNLTARYYAIFLHTIEPNGQTSATTQTVFRLCI